VNNTNSYLTQTTVHRVLGSLLLVVLVACSSAPSATATDPAPTVTEKGAQVDAGALPSVDAAAPSSADASAPPPCALHIDSVDHATFPAGQAANTMVTLHGCGFAAVQDVQVSIASTRFSVVDDATLVFTVPTLDDATVAPYRAEVDVIIASANQVQTFVTYE
jgi:hypothetical protein